MMPRIVAITLVHVVLFGAGGVFLGLMVFGVGFAESSAVKEGYEWLVILWKVFNAPVSYIGSYSNAHSRFWLPAQIITSFVWANIYAFLWSWLRARHK